jgi:hypothetical protein
MSDRMALKKALSVGIISIGLLLGSVGVSLAAEGDSGGHGGGHGTTQSKPIVTEVKEAPMKSSSVEADHSSAQSGHVATPDMDPNMPGHGEPSTQAESIDGGHGEAAGHGAAGGGHGESDSASEGVDWMVVGGFLAINALVIITAGLLKISKKPLTQV